MLRTIAHHGHQNDSHGEQAFRAGLKVFGDWAKDAEYDVEREFTSNVLDRRLDLLTALNGDGRQMLIKAITAVIADDGELTSVEADMMRAVCASLEVPLPPIPVSG